MRLARIYVAFAVLKTARVLMAIGGRLKAKGIRMVEELERTKLR